MPNNSINHADRAHSLLSASGSHRWLACPPSARLAEHFESTSSEAAREGTAAHELMEARLNLALGLIPAKEAHKQIAKAEASEYFNGEMDEHIDYVVSEMTEYVQQLKGIYGDKAVTVYLETQFDLSDYVPDCDKVTGDITILYPGTIEIRDLKYGRGVQVFAKDNPQLLMYALGALLKYGKGLEIENVKTSIIQPRLYHYDSHTIDSVTFFDWVNTVLVPGAELADKGGGELKAGEHCKFCPAKAVCSEMIRTVKDAARRAAESKALIDKLEAGALVSIAEMLDLEALITDYYKAAKEFALQQAKEGVSIPGSKLVRGQTKRRIVDPEGLVMALQMEGHEENDLYVRSLKSLTELEKAVGKREFAKVAEGFVEKPEGELKLVKESEKGEAVNPVSELLKEFE